MNDLNMTILLVDDEPSNIDLLKGVLSPSYKIKAAIKGEVALKIAQKEPPPDLIVLDVMMPAMDGYEVCRQLKASPATANIPVIFVSGHTDPEEQQKGLACGATAFIAKPITPEQVIAAVQAALASKS
jgi:putative two-component system response regulator